VSTLGSAGKLLQSNHFVDFCLLVSAVLFKRPLFAKDGTTCIGIETVDGTEYHADKVVLAAGAWSSTLVDLEDQCVSKVGRLVARHKLCRLTAQAWVYAHMQLSPEEAKEFKDSPVVYNGDIGFFFEPNEYVSLSRW
jgi:sarcosine oxidase/L-pipecolate oxidase